MNFRENYQRNYPRKSCASWGNGNCVNVQVGRQPVWRDRKCAGIKETVIITDSTQRDDVRRCGVVVAPGVWTEFLDRIRKLEGTR